MTSQASAPESVAAAKKHLWGSFGKDPSFFDQQGSIIARAEGSVEDKETKANWDDARRTKIAGILGAVAREQGVIMQPFNQFATSFVSIAPPLNVADADVETILEALESALAAVQVELG